MNFINHIFILLISLFGAFVFYQVFNLATDWKFTIAFIGGSIVTTLVLFLKDKRLLKKDDSINE